MPDNLTIQISADTSKLRADIAKAEAELRRFNKSLRQAADVGDTAQVEAFAGQVDRATRSLAGMRRELRATQPAAKETADSFGLMHKSLGPLAERFESMRGALAAFAGFEALRKGADFLGELSTKIRETTNQAKALGVKPVFLQALQEGLEDAGATAEISKRAMIALADAMTQARQEAGSLSQAGNFGIQVMKGGQGAVAGMGKEVEVLKGSTNAAADSLGGLVKVGNDYVRVMKGGQQATTDLQKPIKSLGLDMSQFTDDAEGNRKAIVAIIDRLKEMQKVSPQVATALGNKLFPRAWADLADAINDLDEEKLKRITDELVASGRAITPEADTAAKAYNKSLKNLGDAFDAIKMKVGTSLFAEVTKTIEDDTRDIEKISKLFEDTITAIGQSEGFNNAVTSVKRIIAGIFDPASYTEMWASFTAWWAEVWPQLTPTLTQWATDVESLFATMWDRIKSAAKSALDAISNASAITADNASITGGAMPFASGGLVPGRGSGDTVPAMLTPGEYVVRRSRVDQLGLGLLNRLNGLRASVLPRRGRTHYAEGGLVAGGSASGAPVILQIGGGSFALAGEQAVVDALVRATRRDNMLSAGRGPMRLA